MPLPKPPANKATILSPADFESQAAPRSDRKGGKSRAEPAASLDLFDGAAPAAAPRLPARGAGKLPATVAPAPVAPPRPASQGMPAKQASLATEPAAGPKPRVRSPRGSGPAKLFVLDTNVLMHDPMSLFRFEEHDVFRR